MRYQIDQSGKIEDTAKDTILALSNGKNSWSVILSKQTKRLLQNVFRAQGKPDMFIYFTFSSLLALLFIKAKPKSQVIIDIEYPGKNDLITVKLLEALDRLGATMTINIRFGLVGKSSPAHELATKIAHKKLLPGKKITLEEIEQILWPQKKIGYPSISGTKGNLSQDWLPVGRKPSQSLTKKSYHRRTKKSTKKRGKDK